MLVYSTLTKVITDQIKIKSQLKMYY